MKNWRSITILVLGVIVWLNSGFAQNIGGINLVFPENEHAFTLREDKIFEWDSPDNLQAGQDYYCHMRLVKMDKDDNPEVAINNEVYYEIVSDPDVGEGLWDFDLDTVYFATTQHFAWQVKAYSYDTDTLIAESAVFRFEGPPLFEFMKADGYKIHTTKFTKVTEDWDSLCGSGFTKVYDDTIQLTFENIRAERSGAEIFLREGELNGFYKDTITLIPETNSSDLNQVLYLDSIKIDSDKTVGLANIVLYQRFVGDTLNVNIEKTWIYLSDALKPLDDLYFKDTTFNVDGINLNLNANSYLWLKSNKYYPVFNGILQYPINDDTLDLKIQNSEFLNYFSSSFETDTLNLTDQIKLSTTACTFDLSDEQSPGTFQDSVKWQGIYFNNLGMDTIKQDSTFAFVISGDMYETFKTETASWVAYFTEDELIVNLDTTFENPKYGHYNYFDAGYNHIKINNLNDTLECDVTAEIRIPYLVDQYFDISIPCSNSVIQLAETDSDSEFQPFPLYELELREFSIIMYDGTDTIPGEIDFDSNEIKVIVPEEDYYRFYTKFDISGYNIILDDVGIVSGEPGTSFDIYGDITYELKISTYDNKSQTYSLHINIEDETTTVNEISKSEIKVYPNPVTDYVEISGLKENDIVQIIDLNGKQMIKKLVDENPEKIDVTELERGVYVIQVFNNNENNTQKIIKL